MVSIEAQRKVLDFFGPDVAVIFSCRNISKGVLFDNSTRVHNEQQMSLNQNGSSSSNLAYELLKLTSEYQAKMAVCYTASDVKVYGDQFALRLGEDTQIL